MLLHRSGRIARAAYLQADAEEIYTRFHLSISDAFGRVLTETKEKSKPRKSEHQYSLDQFGLTEDQIRQTFRDIFERFDL